MLLNNLPSLKQWEYALEGNSKFKEDFHKDLLDSNEDRIALFCRVCNRNSLEQDSRPEFYQWKNSLSFENMRQVEEFFGHPLKDYEKKMFREQYLEAENKRFPPSFIMELKLKFNAMFPKEKFVRRTSLGEMAFSYMDVIEGGELESYINSYLKSFLHEVVFVYKQCFEAKQKGQDYKKLQINWRKLLHKRFIMNDFAEFHRNYYHSNVLGEISSPWKVHMWCYEELIADFVLNALCKDFKLDIITTSGVPKHLYGNYECWLDVDTETFTIDDSVDKMSKSTLYKTFVEKNGKLWDDDFVNSVGGTK